MGDILACHEFAIATLQATASNAQRDQQTHVLRVLTTELRMRAATLLAAAYFLCVLTVPLALAFADLAQASPGHVSEHDGSVQKHSHPEATAHHHADESVPHEHPGHADDRGKGVGCCGALCLNAMSVDVEVSFDRHFSAKTIIIAVDDPVGARGPDRLNRPPIAPLSL